MAFSSRILKHSGPSGKLTTAGAEYRQTWQCTVTDPLDGPITVWNYFKLNGPYFGDYYENGNDTDLGSFVSEIDTPEHVPGSATEWLVQVHYKPMKGAEIRPNSGTRAAETLPWNWSPEVSIGWAQHSKPVYKAKYLDGMLHAPPILFPNDEVMPCNSAGVPFDPPLEKDHSRMVVRIKTYSRYYDADTTKSLIDTINSRKIKFSDKVHGIISVSPPQTYGMFGSFEKHTLKVANIEAQIHRDSFEVSGSRYNIDYYEIHSELHYNPDTWNPRVLDRGMHRRAVPGGDDGRGGTFSITDFPAGVPMVVPIKGPDDDPISEPVLLNGAGFPEINDKGGVPFLAPEPHYIEYQIYEEVDFSFAAANYFSIVFE